jgi:hypothetical protein
VVHLLNNASSWGIHSIYQKLAPLPEELNKQWGFPNQSELRGTWPVREEIIPLERHPRDLPPSRHHEGDAGAGSRGSAVEQDGRTVCR